MTESVGDFAEFYERWIKAHPWNRDMIPTVLRKSTPPPASVIILTPPLRENVRLQIEAAISARTKELEERIRDAELALTTWDDGHNSEYWLRHAPTPPPASVTGKGRDEG